MEFRIFKDEITAALLIFEVLIFLINGISFLQWYILLILDKNIIKQQKQIIITIW